MQALVKNKALLLVLLVCLGIAFEFWTGSRYPALDQKAMMAGTAGLEPLGFDTVMVIKANDPEYLKILKNTVNWAKTNQRGMTFGILFAAALLTLISLFKRKSFEGSWSNSALGVMIGTPLGVCVNCAAPIAKGLHTSGLRLETTLAAMISSPTLNVVVMAMVLSLFPLYMVGLKVGGTLLFLLLVLPLLSKYVFKEEVALTAQRAISGSVDMSERYTAMEAQPPADEVAEQWWPAIKWVVTALARNLWFIIRTTLPLMILAGFLGSLVVILIPLDEVTALLPTSSIALKLAGLALVALVGVFLPVPITFDVIVVAVLMAAGMPVLYAMTLLFTLGIFSVYSYMIVSEAISRKVAVTLFLTITLLGVGLGIVANRYDRWDTARKNAMIQETWPSVPKIDWVEPAGPEGESTAAILARLETNKADWDISSISAPAGLSIAQRPLNPPSSAAGDTLFTMLGGADTGLSMPYQFSVLRWAQPYSEFRGIASGDVHNDGWQDIIVTSQRGLYLFANDAGQFRSQEVLIDGLQDEFVLNAALVDLNDDGWLDIYYSTFRNGAWIIYNENGSFTQDKLFQLPNQSASWGAATAAFGDLDLDGDLDIVLGNWTLGSSLSRQILGRESSRNVLLWNTANGFEREDLAGPDGESLTTIITDYNNDGYPDLIVGNDFAAPDLFYLGGPDGELSLVKKADAIIPASTLLTMSISTADIDNDLIPEIYLGNVSGTDHSELVRFPEICVDVAGTEYEDECEIIRSSQELITRALNSKNPFMCMELPAEGLKAQCLGAGIHLEAWWRNRPELCAELRGKVDEFADICDEYFSMEDKPIKGAFAEYPDQAARRANVLLKDNGQGGFDEVALEYNLREAGWVWNSKFADLDQDEFQDIYIVNGYFNETSQPARESNHLFLNNAGNVFVDATKQAGMTKYSESATYTYVDYDNDGDLDIIMMEVLGPVWLYKNNHAEANAVSFELRDNQGNDFGIGSRIFVYYGDGAGQQMREIMGSGGFSSFDAPLAHFGLGEYNSIDKIEVLWSTGERMTVDGPFETGQRYQITRN